VNLIATCLLRINGDFIKQHFAGSAVYSFMPVQLLSEDLPEFRLNCDGESSLMCARARYDSSQFSALLYELELHCTS